MRGIVTREGSNKRVVTRGGSSERGEGVVVRGGSDKRGWW